MGQKLFHGQNFSGVISEVGNNGVTLLVLQTMPLPKLCIFVFMILIFFNLATSATANGTALSMYTSKGLKADEEPDSWYKTFWCVLFMIIPVGILLLEHSVEGLNVLSTIQSLITISSLPVLVALVVLFWSFGKVLRKDISDGTIRQYVDKSKENKWGND